MPAADRPRERLYHAGAEALSDQELLCCLLGRGIAGESVLVTAQRLLASCGGLEGLRGASLEQLAAIRGVGPAKAAQVSAAIELGRRAAGAPIRAQAPIESPEDAAAWLRPRIADKAKEHFVALLLDVRHRPLRVAPIAVGSLSASLVHPRELFKEAIVSSAAAMIVAHNHPSGDPDPSEHDIALTHRLVEAGALLGIELLDHLIVTRAAVCSLKGLGLLSRA